MNVAALIFPLFFWSSRRKNWTRGLAAKIGQFLFRCSDIIQGIKDVQPSGMCQFPSRYKAVRANHL